MRAMVTISRIPVRFAPGSYDARMLLPALAAWAAVFGWQWLWHAGVRTALIVWLWILVCTVTLAVTVHSVWPRYSSLIATILVLVVTVMTVGVSCTLREHVRSVDPLYLTSGIVTVRAQVSTPPLRAEQRQYDCRADGMVQQVNHASAWQRSYMRVRIYAAEPSCALLQNGAVIQLRARVEPARYGTQDFWLSATDTDESRIVRQPNFVRRTVARMHQAFFNVCAQLSDQGRVLVPGVTLGILGQDAWYAPSSEHESSSQQSSTAMVDESYALALERACATAGIMHLMAVSGSHFALAGTVMRRLCGYVLASRRVRAILSACAYVGLYTLVYPSDAVLRALVAGLLGCAYVWMGRPHHTIGTLCWTVIILIIADPTLATSYGFALSCAAVCGIAIGARPLCERFARILPSPLASALAVTLCAQAAAMPIQMLMNPSIPLWCAPANLLVSWVVDAATICGLVALAVAWLSPTLGSVFATLASFGKSVIERTAITVGNLPHATQPWMQGATGALIMIVCELVIATLIGLTVKAIQIASRPLDRFGSRPARISLRERVHHWVEQATALLHDLEWRRQ